MVTRVEPPVRRTVTRKSPIPVAGRGRSVGGRTYLGASSGPIYQDFTPSMLSADAEIVVALAKLRARARNLERNVSHARRFIQLMEDNVVGSVGFRLQVKAKFASTGEPRVAQNDSIMEAFRDWSHEPVTTDGMMDMIEAARMAVRSWARDGEVFIQVVTGNKYPDGIGLKFIEADLIDETVNQVNRDTGNQIRMGVELDSDERPVAYHMMTRHPGDYQWGLRSINRKYVRVPAEDMIHIFVKRRAHQTRGEPPMAPVMNDVKMMAGYREAEITMRRVAASKMGFFTREDDSGPVTDLSDDAEESGELISEAAPGRFGVLPRGYGFQQFDPNTGSMDFAAFEKQIVRSISTGLGPSYFDLAMDLSDVSYSSIRQGALSDRDFYRGLQRFFIFRLMTPVYRRWLTRNVGLNPAIIILPSQLDTFLRRSTFIARGWAWVDPQKEVKAAVEAIDNRLNSRTRIVAEQGGDFDEIVMDQASEMEKLTAADLVPVSQVPPPEPPTTSGVASEDDAE